MSIISANGNVDNHDDNDSNYFGGLSISSLVSDDYQNDTKDSDGGSTLYQRLQDLEEMASNFVADRPITLVNGHTTFTEIERGKTQEFELRIHQLSPQEVITIEVKILPRYCSDSKLIFDDSSPLSTTLKKQSTLSMSFSNGSTSMQYKPTYVNGSYSIALSTAHGIVPGLYLLTMTDATSNPASTNEMELVSISYNIVPVIQSVIPLEADKILKGTVEANDFVYYRFINPTPSKLIRVSIKPTYDHYGHIGDADLYVTNRYNGLVPVTRESYTWRSTNVGVDTINIHPQDELTNYGTTYIIGVYGYKLSNFEISVSITDPISITYVEVNRPVDVDVLPDKHSYYCMRVDPSKRTKLGVSLSSLSLPVSTISTSRSPSEAAFNIKEKYGRCVHANDSLATSGVFGPLVSTLSLLSSSSSTSIPKDTPSSPPSSSSILRSYQSPDKTQASFSSLAYKDTQKFSSAIELENIPPSAALKRLVFPMAFISSSSMYPTAADHMWRSSGIDGEVRFVINQDEWRYTDGSCYFSIYGLNAAGICPDNDSSSSNDINHSYRLLVTVLEESPSSLSIVESIYQNNDGSIVSQRERNRLSLESHALTYSETDCSTFLDILTHADVGDGLVYYDLGSGNGQCLLAAALSNYRFFKCVGIEILPGLCEISTKAIQKVKDMISKNGSVSSDAYDQFRNSNYHSNSATNSISNLTLPLIEIREGNLLELDWSDADLIYLSSTCYPDEMMRDIFLKCLTLKTGTKIITLKLIDGYHQYFKLEKNLSMKFTTWGNMSVYFLRKL